MFHSKYQVWLSPPNLNGDELNYIKKALDSNWISPYGENILDFESALETYFSTPDVALTNSGTAAIHLALILAEVKEGDEVIVPSLNFAGCVNPILYQKAKPVFIDSEYENFNINPQIVAEVVQKKVRMGRKPAAIIGVDLFGFPCKFEELLAIANEYDIPFIEDAADAIGATYKNKPAGSFGMMGIMSFNGNKIITTSGGGALISDNDELTQKAKYLSNQARSNAPFYNHEEVGYNYMLSNVLAGIGMAQISTVEERVTHRRQIREWYQEGLKEFDFLYFPEDLPDTKSNAWLSVVNIRKNAPDLRNEIFQLLDSKCIESRPVWKPMHRQTAYSGFEFHGNDTATQLFQEGLCLPSGTNMTESQVGQIIDIIKGFLKG
jgi:dTDP-4-amino-4,6-dideoxygalactose transaminase